MNELMRRNLVRRQRQATDALWQRNVAIRDANDAGASVRAIAAAVNLSPSTVQDILKTMRVEPI